MMMEPICMACHLPMRCAHTGIFVFQVSGEFRSWLGDHLGHSAIATVPIDWKTFDWSKLTEIWKADLFRCIICQTETLVGFSHEPLDPLTGKSLADLAMGIVAMQEKDSQCTITWFAR